MTIRHLLTAILSTLITSLATLAIAGTAPQPLYGYTNQGRQDWTPDCGTAAVAIFANCPAPSLLFANVTPPADPTNPYAQWTCNYGVHHSYCGVNGPNPPYGDEYGTIYAKRRCGNNMALLRICRKPTPCCTRFIMLRS